MKDFEVDLGDKMPKEKTTIYLKQETFSAGQDLARLSRLSWPEYIEMLIERDIEANADKLNRFRELCDEN